MTTYFNELAPWEEKKQYHEIINLGTSVEHQTKAIKKASSDQFTAYLTSASSIISSQERTSEIIRSGFLELSYTLNDISKGIKDLGAVFEWGISEVIWQIEQNTEVLRDILRTLESPKETEANERKKWGDNAYASGLLDDALEDYMASEKMYKYDFTIYLSIGMIYLKHIKDKVKALEYYEKAIKYATSKSNYYTSFSLLCKGVVLFDLDRTKEAEESTQESIKISPDFLEAYYQNAQYNVRLGNVEKSLSYLKLIFEKDDRYILKCGHDNLFNPIREQINEMIIKKKDEVYSCSKKVYDSIIIKVINLNKIISEYNNFSDENFPEIYFEGEQNRFLNLINRDSYLDAKESKKLILDFDVTLKKEGEKFVEKINNLVSKLEKENTNEEKIISNSIDSDEHRAVGIGIFLAFVCFIIGLVIGFKGCLYDKGTFGSFFLTIGLWFIIGVIIYSFTYYLGSRDLSKEIKNSELLQTLKSKIESLNNLKDQCKSLFS